MKFVAPLFLISAALLGCGGPVHEGPGTGPEEFDYSLPGKPLNDASYLRKLSYHLRGHSPSASEYNKLFEAQSQNLTDQFFAQSIEGFIDSDQYINKMSFRVEELLRLKPSAKLWRQGQVKRKGPAYDVYIAPDGFNSLNRIVRDIFRKNLSWDQLLLNKTYYAYPDTQTDFIDDFTYFSAVANAKIPLDRFDNPFDFDSSKILKPIKLEFLDDDPRFAGILTTGRFSSRYVSTALNKNRGRAAAAFRIFLCDNMSAVVVDQKSDQEAIFDLVFPSSTTPSVHLQSEGRLQDKDFTGLTNLKDIHGQDKACAKCHYKLDPLGHGWDLAPQNLGPTPAPAALVYRNDSGKLVNQPGRGIGDVAKAIVKQSEYLNCQVSHFWDWFVGSDVILNKKVQNELVVQLEKSGRKPNDFVKHLVSRPEFRSSSQPTENERLIGRVKNILDRCTSCHFENRIPSFTSWPIGRRWAQHKKWLRRIISALDLQNSGRSATMPPASSDIEISSEDYQYLKEWIEKGAPSVNGQKHL